MAHACICVGLPEDGWKADVTQERPQTAVCLSSTSISNGSGVEIVALSGDGIDDSHRMLQNHPNVCDTTTVQQTPTERVIQVETEASTVMAAADTANVPVTYPVLLRDGTARIRITASRERLSEFGAALDTAGLSYTVTSVQQTTEYCPVLTERQSEVLETAVSCGYYETPRRCSLTELADEVGIAKSTCSGILKRIGTALVEEFLQNQSSLPRQTVVYPRQHSLSSG